MILLMRHGDTIRTSIVIRRKERRKAAVSHAVSYSPQKIHIHHQPSGDAAMTATATATATECKSWLAAQLHKDSEFEPPMQSAIGRCLARVLSEGTLINGLYLYVR